jgi:hypothetical protein
MSDIPNLAASLTTLANMTPASTETMVKIKNLVDHMHNIEYLLASSSGVAVSQKEAFAILLELTKKAAPPTPASSVVPILKK